MADSKENLDLTKLNGSNYSMWKFGVNCSTPREIWNKLQDLYGDSSVDAKQNALEQFYVFRMSNGESMAIQVEKLESICKKLTESGEKPTDAAVMTKLLSSLPNRFSVFRVVWDCTPETDRKKSSLIARLIKEEKRVSENEDNVTSLALQVNRINLNSAAKREKGRKNNQDLKKTHEMRVLERKGSLGARVS